MDTDLINKDIYVKTIQTNMIKNLHDSLNHIVNEIEWVFDENGMSTIGIDSSGVLAMYVELTARGFDNGGAFYCKKDKVVRMGINIHNFSVLLKIMKGKHDIFHLFKETNKPEIIQMIIENADAGSRRTWETSTIDCDHNPDDVSYFKDKINQKYDMIVGVPAVLFHQEIKYLERIGTYVDISVHSGKSLSFSIVCDKMIGTNGKNKLNPTDHGIKFHHTTEGKSIVTGRYSLSCLTMFVKCTTLSPTSCVKLHMSMDEPLIVEYSIGNMGFIKFCLSSVDDD